MATIIATAAVTATLLYTSGWVIKLFTGDLKSECQRIQRHVRSMNEYYQLHKNDQVYHVQGLQDALKNETTLLQDIDARLKRETQPKWWMFIKRWKIKNFLKQAKEDLTHSSETMNTLLMRTGTGALIQIADQGQNDPVPQDDDVDGLQEPPLATSTPTKNLDKTIDVRDYTRDFFEQHGVYIPDEDIMVISFESKQAAYDRMVQDSGNKFKANTISTEWKKSFPKCILEKKGTPKPNHTTITITTMKISDINLPCFPSTDNHTGDTALPRVHLTGALFKVRTKESTHIFRNLNHIPHDTNFVVHCLLNLLESHKYLLDETLLLQLHCQQSKINKKILLSSVALLVDQQIFDKIIVRFLPEEPTIKAVETAFSVIDEKLCSEDIPHLDDLDRIIGDITKGQVEEIKYVLDIETWISSYLVKWSTNVNNEIWFRLYKIGENTVMQHDSNLVPKWTPAETVSQPPDSTPPRLDNGVVCFEEPPDVTKSPSFVDSRLDSVIDLVAVEKKLCQKYQSEQSGQYLNKWKSVFDTHREVPASSLSWQLPKLKDEGESGASSLT